jgi:ankyrin repeat protein
MLIRAGASVNRKDSEGATPLHKAAFNGYVEIVKRLIKAGEYFFNYSTQANVQIWAQIKLKNLFSSKGADIEARDSDGGTALMNAVYNGHSGCAAILLKYKVGFFFGILQILFLHIL